eukprot:jgi/Tetstr1/456396/TSEL_043130.t1
MPRRLPGRRRTRCWWRRTRSTAWKQQLAAVAGERDAAQAAAENAAAEVEALKEQVASFKMAVDNMAAVGCQEEAACAAGAYEEVAASKEQIVCLEEALHESNEAARKKMAELEAALASVKAEHAAVLDAQAALGASEAAAAEDQGRARQLVAELESTLEGMAAENARLAQALEEAGSQATPAGVVVPEEMLLELLALLEGATEAERPPQARRAGCRSPRTAEPQSRLQCAAARVAELQSRIKVLEDEKEWLVESEAQTSRELAAVMAKWEDSERRAAQFAAMETSFDASVAAAEQHAEDAEEALEDLSHQLDGGCAALLEVVSHATPTLPATLHREGSSSLEEASLRTQLSAMSGQLQSELQMRSELEQQLARAEGQLVQRPRPLQSAAEQTQRRLKSEVSQLSERLEGDAGKVGRAVPHAGSAEQLDTAGVRDRRRALPTHQRSQTSRTKRTRRRRTPAGCREETSLLAERVKELQAQLDAAAQDADEAAQARQAQLQQRVQ